jgi:hypothetical protein
VAPPEVIKIVSLVRRVDSLFVDGHKNGVGHAMVLDTMILRKGSTRGDLQPTRKDLRTATGQAVKKYGEMVDIMLGDKKSKHLVIVADIIEDANLGMDVLLDLEVTLDLK